MRRYDALAVSVCVAAVVTAAVYVTSPPGPIYYPLEHAWRWEKTPGVPMLWYGRSAVALAAGGFAGWCSGALARRRWTHGAPAWLPKLLSGITLAALIAALGHTVVHEYWNWMR